MHYIKVSKHNSKTLKVIIKQIAGKKKVNRKNRIGYVTDDGIIYSDWTENDVTYLTIIKDLKTSINIDDHVK